jgi:hypothetical protein
MLDGNCYFAEFPDEDPAGPGRIPLSPELLTALAAVEREISTFIRTEPDAASDGAGLGCKPAVGDEASKAEQPVRHDR